MSPAYNKTNKMTCVPSKDSDQPGHPPSLIRVFAGHSIGIVLFLSSENAILGIIYSLLLGRQNIFLSLFST